jgi:hypothetical protein
LLRNAIGLVDMPLALGNQGELRKGDGGVDSTLRVAEIA